VIALDILEMPSLAGVEFLHGDFREDAVLSQLVGALNGQAVDLVLSDMAPNKSGVDAVDMPRAMYLSELAMDFADQHLRTGGNFLIKLFQGVGFDEYVKELRRRYDRVVIRKPEASRKRSPEVIRAGTGQARGNEVRFEEGCTAMPVHVARRPAATRRRRQVGTE
jgi:23S rRNA (uridine2552-2'-O)-methyltransferase